MKEAIKVILCILGIALIGGLIVGTKVCRDSQNVGGLKRVNLNGEKVIEVPDASEYFIEKRSLITDESPEQLKTGYKFEDLVFRTFFRCVQNQIGRYDCNTLNSFTLALGHTSKRTAVIISNYGIRKINSKKIVRSDIAVVYYTNDLQKKLEERELHFVTNNMPIPENKIDLLLPEAKKTAQKFVDSIKVKIKK